MTKYTITFTASDIHGTTSVTKVFVKETNIADAIFKAQDFARNNVNKFSIFKSIRYESKS